MVIPFLKKENNCRLGKPNHFFCCLAFMQIYIYIFEKFIIKILLYILHCILEKAETDRMKSRAQKIANP